MGPGGSLVGPGGSWWVLVGPAGSLVGHCLSNNACTHINRNNLTHNCFGLSTPKGR